MNGKRLGYIRVSSLAQNTARQLEDIQLDKIFTDKVSGKTIERPALEELIDYAREGDIIIVHSMDRLARNLDDLRKLVNYFNGANIKIEFVKESLSFNGNDNHVSKLMLSILGAFSEFERALIKERQLEGIALAKKRGVYKGRKKSLGEKEIEIIKNYLKQGETKSFIAKKLNISRETLYKYLSALTHC